MRRIVLALVAGSSLIALPALAAPGDMSVGLFLDKVAALKAKGAMALFSSDIGTLRAEATAAGQAYTVRLNAERAQRRPSSCPPKGARPSQDQWLAHLNTYPQQARASTNLRAAMADYYIKTWPCR
ncbi:MAG: hypothetical protein KGM18_10220 [Sphingomonadales bacterium]|nr:hypothetical protein [Sphingomonadales bacterium]